MATRAGITMHACSRLWLTILESVPDTVADFGILPLSAVNQTILTLVSVVAAGACAVVSVALSALPS